MLSASMIAPMRIDWLWPARIPLGTLTLFSGDPKLGKSLAAITVVAAVSRGRPLPGAGADGPATPPRGSAILLSAEDDPARTIVPRLVAAGADLDRVHILATMVESGFHASRHGPVPHGAGGKRMPTLSAEDLEVIERRAAALGDCRLIVFDPISAYIAGRSNDVRRALAPLGDMAERLGAAVLLITHHSKQGASSTNGKYRVRGSIEYVCACRANFLFLQDPDDPSGRRRLMLDNGVNLAARQPGLPFVIRDDGAGPCLRLAAGDHRPRRRRRARPHRQGRQIQRVRQTRPPSRMRGVVEGLPRRGTEAGEGMRAGGAMAAGFNRALLERARAHVAIRCLRSGFGKGACYLLCLPEADGEPFDRTESVADARCSPVFLSRFSCGVCGACGACGACGVWKANRAGGARRIRASDTTPPPAGGNRRRSPRRARRARSAPRWQAAVRTFGGEPASVSKRATSALTRLMIAQPVTLDSGATGVSRPSTQTAESPAGAFWSSTRSATSCSFLPDSCREVETAACGRRSQGHDEHPQPLRFQRHVDRHGVAAAGRDGQERVVGRGGEVPPEDRAEALDVLQEHRLPLAVGPDDRVVIGHRQLDDRVKAREMTRSAGTSPRRPSANGRCRRHGPAGR